MTYLCAPDDACVRLKLADVVVNLYHTGPTDGTPVVFLHGGGPGCTGWNDWHPVGEQLDGYRRLYVDLPQFGASSYGPIEGPQLTAYARILAGVLDELSVGAVHGVCQSFGGAVATRLAIDEPDRFLSLSLTGSTPFPYGVLSPMRLATVAAQALAPYYEGGPTPEKLRTLLAVAEWVDADRIPDELVAARFAISSSPEHLALQNIPHVRGVPEDLGPDLGRNTVPTLLAYGDRDPFAPAEIPVHLFSRFPDARLVLFKDASHHFPEEQPDRYLAVARPWLTECEQHAGLPT